MDCFRAGSFVFFALSVLIYLASSEEPLRVERAEGSRVERISQTGRRVNFSWVRSEQIGSWLEAEHQCSLRSGRLPQANEMRYFYKTLRSDDAQLPPLDPTDTHRTPVTLYGVRFYLGDILEATMDYPNTESGERMCLIVEKRPNSPVQLVEVSSVRSCSTPVNLLVCRFALDGEEVYPIGASQSDENQLSNPCNIYSEQLSGPLPQWIVELKKKAELQDNHMCFRHEIFYATASLGCLVIFITTISTVLLAIRYYLLVRQTKSGRRRNNEGYLMAPPSSAPSEVSTHVDGVDAIGEGKMDILADSAFYRAPGSIRDSYKQALITDGYQKLANGLRASRNRQPGVSAVRSSVRASTRASQR
ncbi:hypothetical protein T265_02707 [Opisthorchis viverrini]|uniref:C-type lectin domain-containing protein n=2 Tax=Opisthorchis viverrini TaxID=6198 RepID=A0A075AI53_OPIVI|nr:hypothetical protein T265_02707 [Opisthorchis viverrini]KER31034.1 hypothetical protein T265_02707 [Opisthorchis viverrini]